MPEEIIYFENDNLIEVTDVKNVATDAYINDADVTLTLYDAATMEEITGQTWPLALTYVTGSDGDYRGTINDDIGVAEFQALKAEVIIDGGAGLRSKRLIPVVVMPRTSV